MLIADPAQTAVVNEVALLLETLPLAQARLIELGCGKAEKTRTLAASGRFAEILALEVDAIQHARNLAGETPPGVRFAHGGAEAIPAPDASADLVLMFKSLHHVPCDLMDRALGEIARVLRPGGWAWISEPVFAGEMNEIMRLFHDEQQVRAAAFAAVQRAVAGGLLACERQFFFNTRSQFADFAQFEARMIRVTHSNHHLSPELLGEVERRFVAHLGSDGASFFNPQRVDLLRKPE